MKAWTADKARDASRRWRSNHREQHRAYQRAYRLSKRIPCPHCGQPKKPTAAACRACYRGPTHPKYQGGSITQDGYRVVTAPTRGYPGARKNGTIFEHRLVMAKAIGRPLHADESVHHKNGVRDDNRLENLELWSSWQPGGQRVEDLVRWAREVLARYGGTDQDREAEGW